MNKIDNIILKGLPIGEQSIKTIIKNNYIYVDKTEYIYNIITKNKYYFLSRPRRFGKSLLISTLIEIFSGNKELFKNCWIYNSNYEWKKYPIIHLDFSRKKEDKVKNFYNILIEQLIKIASNYNINLNNKTHATSIFEELVIKLYEKEGQIVFLVDEYDKPILDNIDNLKFAEENRDTLKGIFSSAKSLSGMLRFEFLTGITKFSQTSLFSGPNNLKDLSMSSYYQYLLGYTQNELEFYFKDYIKLALNDEKLNSYNEKDLLNKIREYYNGYLFSHEDKKLETVYNPFSILNFFDDKSFNNYWFKSGTPSYLIKLLNKYIYDIPEDENNITLKISELEKFEVEKINLLSLLFQAGYLTIENYDQTTHIIKLKYPNEEVRISFKEQIEIAIEERFQEEGNNLKEFIEKDDWNNAFKLFNTFCKNISYGSASKYEHYYAGIFQGICQGAGFSHCDSEVHTNDGRIDMVLYANKKIYIIEFKIDSSAEKAISQIRSSKYMDKFLMKNKPIILIGVNFDSDEKGISDWKVENL